MEKVESLSLFFTLYHLRRQPVVFLPQRRKILLPDCIVVLRPCHHRLHGYLPEAQIRQMQHVSGEVQIVAGKCPPHMDFFGGEPLMNWQVVKDLVAYARTQEGPHHKRFRFTLTTNGMLIDQDVIDFANREMDNSCPDFTRDSTSARHSRISASVTSGRSPKLSEIKGRFFQKRSASNSIRWE